jgi:hypothetical protein
MAYEIRELKEVATGAKIWPKFEVYDKDGATGFTLSLIAFKFIDMSTGTAVIDETVSGVYINNSDTDVVGNTIKTFQVPLDMTLSAISEGYYVLVLTVTLTGGEIHKFRVIYHVRNYEEVF